MSRRNNEGKKIIFFICLVLTVMVSVTSVTYAYFALFASDNSIVGISGETGLELDVEKVFPLSGENILVPQLEAPLTKAISTQYSCVDDNGNKVCNVYKATVTNTSTASVKLNGTISFTGIENMPNLKWKRIKDERIIGGYQSHNATTTDAYFERNEIFEPNESMTYYFVVWIDEIGTDQTDSGDFRATIKFNYADGDGLTSTIVPMSYMTGFSSGSDYSYYRSDTYREKIKNVYFVDYIDATGSAQSWDMSDTEMNPAGSVIAWIKTNTSDSNYYDLYIGAELLIGGTDLSYFFYGLSNVEGIYFDNFDTRETTSMYVMFYGCESIVSLDVSGFDTSNVTNMMMMFAGGSDIMMQLRYLDVSGFDTSNVTNMMGMFQNNESLTNLDVSGFDTSQVTNMSWMFNTCSELTYLDVSKWNTSKVTDMAYMFWNCISLKYLDVSGFDTVNVTTMHAMFCGGYDDENGVNNVMSVTTLNLSGWDTSKVTNTEAMFSNCAYLTTALPIKNVGTTTYENMFLRAATESGAKITVNYTSATSSLVDSMIQTKSENSNVVKGSLIS